MDLSFFNTKNLFEASYYFFNKILAVPTTQAITKQKLSLRDVMRDDVFKSREPYTWVTETYFLGTIDDSAFENAGSKTDFEEAKKSKYESVLLFSLKIENEKTPTKGQLAELTRALNRSSLDKPVMVLFKYGDYLTCATTERTKYQRKHLQGEKIGKISLLKDIYIPRPHAGHERILFELTVNPLETTNYTELYEKWQKVFDLQLLNKTFYRELFYWYLWAVRLVKFPKPTDDKNDDHTHSSISVIRLLTRLIFVWFVKEKKLIPEDLFNRKKLLTILKNFIPESETDSNYYKAILQNLFFATLNTDMNKDIPGSRQFISDHRGPKGQTDEYSIPLVYRYKELFQNDFNAVDLFENIPFLNGGLFECLDFFDNINGKNIEKRYDGFSTKKDKQPFVPNILFFGKDSEVDFSKEFGDDRSYRHEKVRGIIDILSSYKFTITENTPIEEEIALDPELLGKVFENLLASYNPETQKTARKQTGSFYTPREIVNYIVDESLKAYLLKKLALKNILMEPSIREKIDFLFSYANSDNPFDKDITLMLIDSISNCRILDPACGSGAFPMGALHRMVYLLGKLDPKNVNWKNSQLQKAQADMELATRMTVREIRDKAIESAEMRIDFIKQSFSNDHHELDYTRKLFLIENCIYGVDIQQIAVQISKLRFFISLIVDQKVIDSNHNRNILSMPNLETKFVAANTLIDLEKKEGQLNLMGMNEEIYQKELFLKKTRQEIFYTRRYSEKKKLKVLEQKGRIELKEILLKNDFAKSEAEQMAEWNPFDPINAATFFDSMTMFGFKDGFDIIIGNPPYIFTRDADFSKDFKEYISKYYFSHLSPNEKKSKANQSGKINLFALFIMRGLFEAKKHGLLSYIVPNNLLRTTTYDLIRKYLLDNSKIEELVDLGSNVFDNVTASTIIIRISKIKFNPDHEIKIITEIKNLECCDFTLSKIEQKQFIGNISYTFNLFANSRTSNLLSKISNNKIELGKYCIDIIEGIVAHKYLINDYKTKDNEPLLEGKTIRRYGLNSIKKYITWHVNEIHRTRPDYLWASPQKIVIQRISGGLYPLTATIDNNKYKTFASVNNLLLKTEYNHEYEFFLALINSKIINWFYANSFSNNSTLTVNISKTFLEKLPIIDVSDSIKEIIKYFVCITIKTKEINQDVISEFFEQLIDAIVYELYLKEIIQNAECQILKHLTDLPELNKSYDQIKNLKIINSVYYKLKNLDHPVSVAMKKMQEIDEVKIFEGKL